MYWKLSYIFWLISDLKRAFQTPLQIFWLISDTERVFQTPSDFRAHFGLKSVLQRPTYFRARFGLKTYISNITFSCISNFVRFSGLRRTQDTYFKLHPIFGVILNSKRVFQTPLDFFRLISDSKRLFYIPSDFPTHFGFKTCILSFVRFSGSFRSQNMCFR